jgi:hypothetical protein
MVEQSYWEYNQPEKPTLRYISLGAGVQSSVLALMASRGEIKPIPDFAIFADTQWEPAQIYKHLDWLEKQLSFPVYRVSYGDIRKMSLDTLNGCQSPSMPVFINNAEGGIIGRQCTQDYKIDPIYKKVRELMGYKKGQRLPKDTVVESWMGISRDEIRRMKDSRKWWVINRYPLIELGMTRHQCREWFSKHYPGRTLSRSACIGCPYRNDKEWRQMRDQDPVSWSDAVEFDHAMRSGESNIFHLRNAGFLHSSMIPLDEVDLSTEQDRGQLDMFGEECEGMCGV